MRLTLFAILTFSVLYWFPIRRWTHTTGGMNPRSAVAVARTRSGPWSMIGARLR
jgi:hypothetical protein